MVALMRYRRVPVALVAIVVGVAVGQTFGLTPPLPHLDFGLHLPQLVVPSWPQILHGTIYAVLPQVPLTLTNAIIVTAAVSRQLFPKELHPVNERNLAITTGLGNLLAAPFGGYLMCHGAGGMAGHVRFGARTATAPVLIGLVFLVLGVGFGSSGYALLRTIPNAVLGSLLFFSGIELAISSKPHDYPRHRPVPDLADGGDRRRAQPGCGLRCRPAARLRVQARLAQSAQGLTARKTGLVDRHA